jgi:hypothetical protein
MINDLLPGLLETAVRLQIMALQEMDAKLFRSTWQLWTNDTYLTESGLWNESALFGGKDGERAQAFNAMAKAIACLAFMPGGIRAFNVDFAATRADGATGLRTKAEMGE